MGDYREIVLSTTSEYCFGDTSAPSWNLQNYESIKGYKVKEIVIPLSWYLFDSRNNGIAFEEKVGNTVTACAATITPGNFNSASIATELQTRLNAATANAFVYTVTFNASTNKLTVACTGQFRVLYSSTAKYELGIDADGSFGTSYTTGVIDLSGSKVIHCVCTGMNSKLIYPGSTRNILFSMPISDPLASVSVYRNEGEWFAIDDEISKLSLYLVDELFRSIDLHGKHWMLTLALRTG